VSEHTTMTIERTRYQSPAYMPSDQIDTWTTTFEADADVARMVEAFYGLVCAMGYFPEGVLEGMEVFVGERR